MAMAQPFDRLMQALHNIHHEAELAVMQRMREDTHAPISPTVKIFLSRVNADEPDIYNHIIKRVLFGKGKYSVYLRKYFGWVPRGVGGIGKFDPPFWNLVGTWPPRDSSLAHTLMGIDPDLMQTRYRRKKSEKLLDIGFGTGLVVRALRGAGYTFPVYGIEVNKRWVDLARRSNYPDFFSDLLDVTKLDMIGYFTAAVSFMVHHHIKDFKTSMERIYSSLKAGGTLSFTDLTAPGAIGRPGGVDKIYPQGGTMILRVNPETKLKLLVPEFAPRDAHVKPHPDSTDDYQRDVKTIAETLLEAGFSIESGQWLDPMVVNFVCRKSQS